MRVGSISIERCVREGEQSNEWRMPHSSLRRCFTVLNTQCYIGPLRLDHRDWSIEIGASRLEHRDWSIEIGPSLAVHTVLRPLATPDDEVAAFARGDWLRSMTVMATVKERMAWDGGAGDARVLLKEHHVASWRRTRSDDTIPCV